MAAGVLRKGGGLSEAFGAADAAAGPPGREQQQMQQQLAGDWQGAEDGLSDVELELLLAEFSYVEQVGRVSGSAEGARAEVAGLRQVEASLDGYSMLGQCSA